MMLYREVRPMNTILSDQEAVDRLIESTEKDIDIQADELMDLVGRVNRTYIQAMIAAYEEEKSQDELQVIAISWGRILRRVAQHAFSPDVLCCIAAPFSDKWQPSFEDVSRSRFVIHLWTKALDEADATAECFTIRDSLTGADHYLDSDFLNQHKNLCIRCDKMAMELGERDKPHGDEWVMMYREQFIEPYCEGDMD